MAEQSPPLQASQGSKLKEVGGFEIISKLGQGGMGAVFKARQKSLDRIVALKILPPKIAKDATFIERFQREARASAKLNHPNIVQGIDVGKDAPTGLWYFAMEFVDGPSLQQVLKEQNVIPEERALKIVRDVAQALECAASHGIVHRDIKPDNILLTQRDEAKLADLGLAKQLSDDASVTQSGQSVGTPNYMAPEQARGAAAEVDIRSDIYALGATLFHLVTGQTPFKGETSVVIMTKHLTEPPPRASKVNPEVSEACSRMIVKMMQKKRDLRFQTPKELLEQIEKVLLREDSAEHRPARQERETTGPRAPVTSRAASAAKPSGALGYGLAAAAALAVLAFVLTRSKPADGPTAAGGVGEKSPAPAGRAPAVAPQPKPAPAAGPAPAQPEQPAQPDQASPVPTPAEPVAEASPEKRAQKLLAELQAQENDKALTSAELRAAYDRLAREFAETDAGKLAAERLKALPAAPVPPPNETATATVEKPFAKPAEPAPPRKDPAALEAEQAEARNAKAFALFAAVLKESAPLTAQNRLADANALLDRKIKDPALADARDLLVREKGDLESIQELRRQAIEALRKLSGKTVSLRMGKGLESGKIKDDPKPDSVTLQIPNGPVMSRSSEQLHLLDVDAHAPKPTSAEDFRRRGVLFLAAGDVPKAKEWFVKAREAGLAGEVASYFERISIVELGEVEVAAQKAWLRAEALFSEKRFKEAEEAYTAFQQKYAKSRTLAQNVETIKVRLLVIEKVNKPEYLFRPKESMALYPIGHKRDTFPTQESDDAAAVFEGKPIYFNQTTGTDVVYEIRSPRPLRQLRWKGAAMQKMTIEILDLKGQVLSTGGPYAGGNKWAEFTLNFDPNTHFLLRFSNHVSTWYLIAELELK